MYCILDLDRLAIAHKHADFEVVCNLAEIELPGAELSIAVFDSVKCFYPFTEAELAKLYGNLTGATTARKGNDLRALIVEAIYRLPETLASATEADRQAEFATLNRAAGPFAYVRGATRPAKQAPGVLTTVQPANSEADAIIAAGTVAATLKAARPAHTTRQCTDPAPAASQRPASAPRGSGVRATIWDKADEMWEAAGKPMEKAQVLALRKAIMGALELAGVKRTSSSNELGNWQKARIV